MGNEHCRYILPYDESLAAACLLPQGPKTRLRRPASVVEMTAIRLQFRKSGSAGRRPQEPAAGAESGEAYDGGIGAHKPWTI